MSAVDTPVTRRVVLAGALASMLTACTSGRHRHAPDPDADVLAAARRGELDILAATDPAAPQRAAHLAHLHALGGTVPTNPAAPAPASAPTPANPAIDELVRASVPALQSAADAARDGGVAAVLASVAASHSAMAART